MMMSSSGKEHARFWDVHRDAGAVSPGPCQPTQAAARMLMPSSLLGFAFLKQDLFSCCLFLVHCFLTACLEESRLQRVDV